MPDAYLYGLTGDVDVEHVSDTERMVIMTPVVICVRAYLANEINIILQPKNGLALRWR